jgi:thiamine pyrophosphate-dependent acetolactate synthase large subunit-like protein
MEQADFALAIGTELANPDRWAALPDWRGRFARIDIDPAQLDRGPHAGIAVQGDARTSIAALLDGLPARDAPAWYGDLAPVRQPEIDIWQAKSPTIVSTLADIRAALPDDAVVVSDMTQIAYAGGWLFPARRPQGWLHPTGYGTLGYGMPAALGAQIGAPDRMVVGLAGDYGFGFSGPELATAAANGIGLTTIIWNNRRLGQIQDDMDDSGIPRVAVQIDPPDFDLFARAHGATYTNTESSNRSIKSIMEDARDSGTPAVIEVAEP